MRIEIKDIKVTNTCSKNISNRGFEHESTNAGLGNQLSFPKRMGSVARHKSYFTCLVSIALNIS